MLAASAIEYPTSRLHADGPLDCRWPNLAVCNQYIACTFNDKKFLYCAGWDKICAICKPEKIFGNLHEGENLQSLPSYAVDWGQPSAQTITVEHVEHK